MWHLTPQSFNLKLRDQNGLLLRSDNSTYRQKYDVYNVIKKWTIYLSRKRFLKYEQHFLKKETEYNSPVSLKLTLLILKQLLKLVVHFLNRGTKMSHDIIGFITFTKSGGKFYTVTQAFKNIKSHTQVHRLQVTYVNPFKVFII